jgi:alpha-beta hydrolase superfamily lysophospholipase
VELAYFEWRRELRCREATILLTHATGFHARVWDQMIRHLGERYVIAVDQRGHGRSQKTEITHWKVFGQDLTALVRELDLRDVMDFSSSPTWPGLVHEFRDSRELHLAAYTHFLPMEAPELVARYVLGKEAAGR